MKKTEISINEEDNGMIYVIVNGQEVYWGECMIEAMDSIKPYLGGDL